MNIHTCLWNEVDAFDFDPDDFEPLSDKLPNSSLSIHKDEASFLANADKAEVVLTWDFPEAWYQHCPNLQIVLTPAAGDDWIEPDPSGSVKVIHGSFHGQILAESLLHAILFMNHAIPDMIRNFQERNWDRNLQKDCRLLSGQTVLIIGMGNIGQQCARLIEATGAKVIGVRRKSTDKDTFTVDDLDRLLPEADHVVLLLPGSTDTDRLLSPERIRLCRQGVFLYNFGRGNALLSKDVIDTADHIGGAFLDVTDEEPLPTDSPLWQLSNVMITPHSSCVYDEYKSLFIAEAVDHLVQYKSRA